MEQRVTFKRVDNSGTIAAEYAPVSHRIEQRMPTRQVVRYHVYKVEGRKLEVQRIGTTLASDVSTTGMFLSHAELTPGTRIHFYFELPSGYLEAIGKVVHNQHRLDAAGVARPGAGVRFIRMSATDKRRLESYLAGRSTSHRFSEARG
jgi:hypothetical protein